MAVKALEIVKKIRDRNFEETKRFSIKKEVQLVRRKAEEVHKRLKTEKHPIRGDIGFEEFERWAAENLTKFQEFLSLGGKVHFKARYDQRSGSIVIRNSKYKEKLLKNPIFDGNVLKREAVRRIFERFIHASDADRFRPGYYMLPPSKEKYYAGACAKEYWPDAPDKIATSAIAAVMKSWFLGSVKP